MANLKLYTNGCSFTHGTVPFVEDDHEYDQMYNGYKYTAGYDGTQWPWLLSQKFDFVFNHARYGTGVDRLVRTTFDFLNHIEPAEYNDWVFVLQLSQPHRREYTSGETERFGQVYPSFSDPTSFVMEYRYTDTDWCDIVDYGKSRESDSAMDFHAMWENDISLRLNQIKNIFVLQSVLEARKIKYLITSMMRTDKDFVYDYDHARQSDTIASFDKLIDRTNFVESVEIAMLSYGRSVYKEDGHLNDQGNRIFANYITQEMEKRNWLT